MNYDGKIVREMGPRLLSWYMAVQNTAMQGTNRKGHSREDNNWKHMYPLSSWTLAAENHMCYVNR